MARSFFTAANTVKQALSAATAKTALQVTAPTNQRVAVQQITVSFDGALNSATPVTIQLVRQTTAGTTSSPSATAKKKDSDISTAIQTTVADGFTAEPTSTDVLWTAFVHPQTGMAFPFPTPGNVVIAGGGRVGVLCNAPAAVDVLVSLDLEE